VEPSKFLEKLKGFVETKKEAKKEGNAGWITGLIVFIVALIGVFVFAWQANKKAKELAKLRHEKNKREIERKNAETARQVAKNDEESDRLGKQISDLGGEIHKTEVAIERAKEARHKDREAINSITSWNDI
jgi:septal ring factor EnvC (AmiA/AmiB activator)